MSKIMWKSFFVSPLVFSAALVVSQTAIAAESANLNTTQILEEINRYSAQNNSNSLNQVTNVNQLRDVNPTDWAYEALRNLVDNYGCIAGYADGTFRGNRAMTRYEFAAGLSACLQQIERLIAATGQEVTRDDLATITRLVQEFETELAGLSTRVDNLEEQVSTLEDNQFSVTTKLSGEAIIAGTANFGDDVEDDQVALGNRVRLELDTSLTGNDRLRTRLAMGNLEATDVDGSAQGTQTFNLGANGNDVELDKLTYENTIKLPVAGQVNAYIAAAGGEHHDYAETLNPQFQDFDGGNGALSTFATENPIYRIGGGAGAAGSIEVGSATATVGYLASNANSPEEGEGLFNGDYSVLGQANVDITDSLGVGVTYVHGYHAPGSPIFGSGSDEALVGTTAANLANGGGVINTEEGKVTNSYGAEVAWRPSDKVSLSGYVNYTDVIAVDRGDAEVWTWGAGLALPDFGKEGNVLGVFGGVQPYLGGTEDAGLPDNPWHVEAFYKYQVTDNVSVTPGVIWQTNVNQDGENSDNFIGTLRTTFNF